ncbi:YolD-like family protein [Bacillus sp. OTU2372]|uniref:YolD-like family protein n=1 Tax=Bacillus sp. OTU2372 TaxID=3043858 RepID=UPI00313BAFF3
MFKDQERQSKPLIDEYEMDEFDQRICYAMEYNLAVKLKVWKDGFTTVVVGSVYRVDPISHEVHIEIKLGEFERIKFEDIIGVSVD